jgi:hypothetical protein
LVQEIYAGSVEAGGICGQCRMFTFLLQSQSGECRDSELEATNLVGGLLSLGLLVLLHSPRVLWLQMKSRSIHHRVRSPRAALTTRASQ